jgi:hypothetical protein
MSPPRDSVAVVGYCQFKFHTQKETFVFVPLFAVDVAVIQKRGKNIHQSIFIQ